ncbi:hypothetical protein PRUPE_3G138900 [Prunus persica]|uniref:Uncharacterized protein n=1 Tax=Prunus persica TaxID=3760 RepID=A0A251Q150_PRUPE|nr:hypothetical protein PRUPE_3G138900 [Prunus persica]ONI17120.1 hypothetical protein PRUPE_3G138900 [Prunus persica]
MATYVICHLIYFNYIICYINKRISHKNKKNKQKNKETHLIFRSLPSSSLAPPPSPLLKKTLEIQQSSMMANISLSMGIKVRIQAII